MSDVSWEQSRHHRRTEATFAVTGAPTMDLLGREAVPYEVVVAWYSGKPTEDPVVRGWKLRTDGTASRQPASTNVNRARWPRWLADLMDEIAEPLPECSHYFD